MPTNNNIYIITEDETRRNLLIEQLQQTKKYQITDNTQDAALIIKDGWSNNTKENESHLVISLDKGAIRLGEIIDRVNYTVSGRMSHIETDQEVTISEFTLRPNENTLIHNLSQEIIYLTDKERLLLRVLYDAQNNTLDRATLLKLVWNYVGGTETHTLETHLYRLRQKLEKYNAQNIITADGNGNYKLHI